MPQHDNLVLCESGKLVNPDDASGAALEEALGEVAVRKCRSGAPDEWQLQKEAWNEYDPAFHHISTRAHQTATENRPKPSPSSPYAPRPARAHLAFQRIRRDLTADSCILAIAYRILHVYCYQNDSNPSDLNMLQGNKSMYDKEIKSETVLARALHLLTLGAYAWDSEANIGSTSWRESGGDEIGSVFYNQDLAPNASDWVKMALLRKPDEIMKCTWYDGKENALTLLKKIAYEGGNQSGFLGGVDPSLRSGAAWLCDYAAKHNPVAAAIADSAKAEGKKLSKQNELEDRKKAAKEKAMAMMKAQMAKFAANLGDADDDDMSEGQELSRSPSRTSDEGPTISTPIRTRTDSVSAVEAMDLSPTGDFILTSPLPSNAHKSPFTPRTPNTPHSACSTPRTDSQHVGARLLNERPQCRSLT